MYARAYSRSRGGFSLKGLIRGAGRLAGGALNIASRISGGAGLPIASSVTGTVGRALAGSSTPVVNAVAPGGVNLSLSASGGRGKNGEGKKHRHMNAGNASAARRAIRRIKSVRHMLKSIEAQLPRRPAARSAGVITRAEAARALRS